MDEFHAIIWPGHGGVWALLRLDIWGLYDRQLHDRRGLSITVQGSIGRDGGHRDRAEVDQEAVQTRPQDVIRRQTYDRRCTEPDRKDSQLDSRRHADEVAAARVVGIREARRNADHGRERKAG